MVADLQRPFEIVKEIKEKYRVEVIRTKRREVVGELVVRFYVSGLEYFEWWSRQGELIPPWVTHWYQLSENIQLRLKGRLLEKLYNKAVQKAVIKLSRRLDRCVN